MNGNKEVMAANIKFYMEQQNVNATEICRALNIKQNTFSDWVNAKTYPRIDKIEKMANYFGISKAHLVEAHPMSFETPEQFEKKWLELGGGRHQIVLSDKEYKMIINYRAADEIDQRSVDRILRLANYAKLISKGINKKGE